MNTPIIILIVDDEPRNLTVLESILDDPGYRLVRAESGEQALLALVVEEFALLILDVRMPSMTGFELAHRIKERKKTAQVPIIFLTALADEFHEELEGYGTGAVDYLHKPVNPVVLRSKVAVFAELSRNNRVLLAEITERRRAEAKLYEREERLRTILNTAADAIITFDSFGDIQSVNTATLGMFGYTTELIGQNIRTLIWSSSLAQLDDVKKIMGIGCEVVAQRKDGSTFPVELAISEVSQLNLFTGIFRDITRRKELELEVVEIASEEQRRIGQDLHDSVGQELTALNILAGDLADTIRTDPEDGLKLVKQIVLGLQRSQQELRTVMRGLLPVPVDSEGLMAALFDLADRVQNEGKANCTFHCPKPVSVADNPTATQLYLIAQEAVRNAVRHAQPRNIRISLESKNFLSLKVQDDGVGLSPRIKARRARGDDSAPLGSLVPQPASRTPRESSLGLRIMRNRAAIIGTRLTVQPTEPTGTRVECVLRRKHRET